MTRINRFKSLNSDPWFKRVFKKLKSNDVEFCINWINDNDRLNEIEFEKAVHRMFLDKVIKPDRWVEITELLHCVRSP